MFYIRNDREVIRRSWQGNYWQSEVLTNGWIMPRANSPIQRGVHKVIFIGTNDKVHFLWWNAGNNSWQNIQPNGNAPAAKQGSHLCSVEGRIYYVNNQDELTELRYNWSSQSWNYVVHNGVEVEPGSFIKARSGMLFFVDKTSSRLKSVKVASSWNIGDIKTYVNLPKPFISHTNFDSDGPVFGGINCAYVADDNRIVNTNLNSFEFISDQYGEIQAINSSIACINGGIAHFRKIRNFHIDGMGFWQRLPSGTSRTYFWEKQDLQLGNLVSFEPENKLWMISGKASELYNLGNFSQRDEPYLNGNIMMVNHQKFTPVGVNYLVSRFTPYPNGGSTYMGPHSKYSQVQEICRDQANCDLALRADFADLRSRGFNTLRIPFGVEFSGNQVFSFAQYNEPWNGGVNLDLDDNTNKAEYINDIMHVCDVAIDEGFKIILLTGAKYSWGPSLHKQANLDWLGHVVQAIQSSPVYRKNILMLDFYNEFDVTDENVWPYYLDKEDNCGYIYDYTSHLRSLDSNILITASVITIEGAAFNWDLNRSDIDVFSVHSYPEKVQLGGGVPGVVDPAKVWNDLYWYSTNLTKPYMVQEIGLSSSNESAPYGFTDYPYDWGSLVDQENFQQTSFDMVFDGGSLGYTWWAFRDVSWYGDQNSPDFHNQFHGLFGWDDVAKPIAASNNWQVSPSSGPLSTPARYFTYYAYTANYPNIVSINVVNTYTSQPIAGAVIKYFDPNGGQPYLTFTDESGSATLNYNAVKALLRISQSGFEKKDVLISTSNLNIQLSPNIPCTPSSYKVHMEENSGIADALLEIDAMEFEADNIIKETQLVVHPNPTHSVVYVDVEFERVEILDVSGRNVLEFRAGQSLNLELLDPGLYTIRVVSARGGISHHRIIKE